MPVIPGYAPQRARSGIVRADVAGTAPIRGQTHPVTEDPIWKAPPVEVKDWRADRSSQAHRGAQLPPPAPATHGASVQVRHAVATETIVTRSRSPWKA